MTPSTWLPDGPAGWVLIALLVAGLAWWAARRVPRATFGAGGARRLARQRGWLAKAGPAGEGDLSGDGAPAAASWEHAGLPRTDFELLGEHRGYVFHARQQRTRAKTSAGHPGTHSFYWRYDYVVSIATTPHPYDGFFTRGVRQPITDWRLALYPAFLEWERAIFESFDLAGNNTPPNGYRSGHGLVSVERRAERLSRQALLAHLDQLVDSVQPGMTGYHAGPS
ncbi:hypothetical protein B0I33_11393 [Prauserella shujinwangii]|uniref:Uncharacterized protein n=1 Tax=Prauserella shujinwangii TaxID=1453103 RepID=A0A2T0LLL9_9PSEU|nr:hypothetical protein [Prauserella shujinwangii]PRX43927.1 hypothetical protein B0I33_11393 [Prauserella shujinwangii]